jgi:hypothetical protein
VPEALSLISLIPFTPQCILCFSRCRAALIGDWWGRTIFRVDEVDALYQTVLAAGYIPILPQNGAWGERYFHLTDPNGHDLSFAQLLT